MHGKRLALWLVAAVLVGGCQAAPTNSQNTPGVPAAGPDDLAPVVAANNRCAFDLYRRLRPAAAGENLFFSPYSISAALAMTCEGARGATAEEIAGVCHFPSDISVRRSGYAALHRELNQPGRKYRLRAANALWAQRDYPFRADYFATVENYYGGRVTNLDFATRAEPARREINGWVEKQTEEKIRDLIPPGALDALTRLVLTNAIYFKGEWVRQFDPALSRTEDFRAGGKTTKTPMMRRTDDESVFGYAEDGLAQVLELPYAGDDLSMLLLLPRSADPAGLENALSPEKIAAWTKSLEKRRVDVYLPRFKFETKYFMARDLAALGMPAAFTEQADFSGMSDRRDLYISEVIHQAFVEVNEEGTEAAAATAVIMRLTAAPVQAPPIPVFRADRPFVFMIRQVKTGNILFLGRVGNPAAQ